MARIFGAPVIEPPGNAPRNKSHELYCSASSPSTVLTRWCTAGKLSISNNLGTMTEFGVHTFEISLRSKSTIIKFSARSFVELTSVCAFLASFTLSVLLGIVPFIGLLCTLPCLHCKKRSGETLKIAAFSKRIKAENGALFSLLRAQ